MKNSLSFGAILLITGLTLPNAEAAPVLGMSLHLGATNPRTHFDQRTQPVGLDIEVRGTTVQVRVSRRGARSIEFDNAMSSGPGGVRSAQFLLEPRVSGHADLLTLEAELSDTSSAAAFSLVDVGNAADTSGRARPAGGGDDGGGGDIIVWDIVDSMAPSALVLDVIAPQPGDILHTSSARVASRSEAGTLNATIRLPVRGTTQTTLEVYRNGMPALQLPVSITVEP